jgi:putative component of membrane protein insertase Oxa1/YidC/SpoIIIJ protein YidD
MILSPPEVRQKDFDFERAISAEFGFPQDTGSTEGAPVIERWDSSPSLPARLILLVIRLYRRSLIHRWKHRNGCPCMFIPTCTEYIARAVVKHGSLRGLHLGWRRLGRCNAAYRGPYIDFP